MSLFRPWAEEALLFHESVNSGCPALHSRDVQGRAIEGAELAVFPLIDRR